MLGEVYLPITRDTYIRVELGAICGVHICTYVRIWYIVTTTTAAHRLTHNPEAIRVKIIIIKKYSVAYATHTHTRYCNIHCLLSIKFYRNVPQDAGYYETRVRAELRV